MNDAATNLAEVSVSELAGAIKRTVEDAFGYVKVRGEVSGYRGPSASGHVYFGLKDHSAKIDAVIWKGVFGRLRTKPEEGLEVIATGKVSTFPGSSKYQLVIDSIEPAGVGALLLQLEERRKRLAAEGLFDAERKRPLPYLPAVIGVVTSPTGAVIRDIIHRIGDRFPLHILVWPVRVQGESSPAEVAAAIRGFNRLPADGPIPRPDVLVVARGGGSLEDLWGFNDEAVVRAAAESDIPLVSAVGHETDTTLIDHAADLRAPTPTGAAEMIVPVRAELRATTEALGARLSGGLRRLVERRKTELRATARGLPVPEALLAQPRQRLDMAGQRLPQSLRGGLDRRRVALSGLSQRLSLQSPLARLASRRATLDGLAKALDRALSARLTLERAAVLRNRDKLAALAGRLALGMDQKMRQRHERLSGLGKLLTGYSYQGVLDRGFALVRDEHGQPVRDAAAVAPGMGLTVKVSQGDFAAIVAGGAAPPARRPARQSAPTPQNDLFG